MPAPKALVDQAELSMDHLAAMAELAGLVRSGLLLGLVEAAEAGRVLPLVMVAVEVTVDSTAVVAVVRAGHIPRVEVEGTALTASSSSPTPLPRLGRLSPRPALTALRPLENLS